MVQSGIGVVATLEFSKLELSVRFRYPAPNFKEIV